MDSCKELILKDQFLALVWKASHTRAKSNRPLFRVLIRIDLIRCLNLITRNIGRQSSLSLMASLMLGLCNVLTYQTQHCFANQISCIQSSLQDLNNWFKSNLPKSTASNTVPYGGGTLSSVVPLFRLLKKVDEMLEAEVYLPIETIAKSQQDVNLYDEHNWHLQGSSCPTDADIYFGKLRSQIDSVDFMEDCQDILDKHFGNKHFDKSKSKRFSGLHANTPIRDSEDFLDGFCETDSFDKDPIQIVFKRKQKPFKVTKKPRKKDILFYSKQIEQFVQNWKNTKLGYRCLAEECQNFDLTKPSKEMGSHLKQYFKPSQPLNENWELNSPKDISEVLEF